MRSPDETAGWTYATMLGLLTVTGRRTRRNPRDRWSDGAWLRCSAVARPSVGRRNVLVPVHETNDGVLRYARVREPRAPASQEPMRFSWPRAALRITPLFGPREN